MSPVFWEWPLLTIAWVRKISRGISPTWAHGGVEHDIGALDRGGRGPFNLGEGVSKFEKITHPGHRESEGIEIIDHMTAFIWAEINGQTFHCRCPAALGSHDRSRPKWAADRSGCHVLSGH